MKSMHFICRLWTSLVAIITAPWSLRRGRCGPGGKGRAASWARGQAVKTVTRLGTYNTGFWLVISLSNSRSHWLAGWVSLSRVWAWHVGAITRWLWPGGAGSTPGARAATASSGWATGQEIQKLKFRTFHSHKTEWKELCSLADYKT